MLTSFAALNATAYAHTQQHPGELECDSRRVRPAATMGRPQVRQLAHNTAAIADTCRQPSTAHTHPACMPSAVVTARCDAMLRPIFHRHCCCCLHEQGQYADHPSVFLHKHAKEPVLPERKQKREQAASRSCVFSNCSSWCWPQHTHACRTVSCMPARHTSLSTATVH